MSEKPQDEKCIVIMLDGPYTVYGGLPLVQKTQIVSEYGEPLTWRTDGVIPTGRSYTLCRCGQSRNKPFCDETHLEIDFDGTETASNAPTTERQWIFPGTTGIHVRKDPSLCSSAGFCGNRLEGIAQIARRTQDPIVRAQVMAMVERCPSGSLTYSLEPGQADIEPDYPDQVAATIEITSDGPINGPLWVTGNILIVRSDGVPLERRNRVTLCCCGRSRNKPFCDGSHRE